MFISQHAMFCFYFYAEPAVYGATLTAIYFDDIFLAH